MASIQEIESLEEEILKALEHRSSLEKNPKAYTLTEVRSILRGEALQGISSVDVFIKKSIIAFMRDKYVQLEDLNKGQEKALLCVAVKQIIGCESEYKNPVDQDTPYLIKFAHELYSFLDKLKKTDFEQMDSAVIKSKVDGLAHGTVFETVLNTFVDQIKKTDVLRENVQKLVVEVIQEERLSQYKNQIKQLISGVVVSGAFLIAASVPLILSKRERLQLDDAGLSTVKIVMAVSATALLGAVSTLALRSSWNRDKSKPETALESSTTQSTTSSSPEL